MSVASHDDNDEDFVGSVSSDDGDTYPPGFPLPPDVYDQNEFAEEEALDDLPPGYRDGTEEDLAQYRHFESLYPYRFLDPNGVLPAPQGVVQRPLAGQLREEIVRKVGLSGHHVEFVPPWTDPQWDERFKFTGRKPREPGEPVDPNNPNPNDDPEYAAYVKEGMMQTQRPALRDEDAIKNPTDAAKRFGIDPYHVDNVYYGNSGATPMQPNFNVPLQNPRETPSHQGVRAAVDKADYDAVYDHYRNAVAAQGGYPTEDDFRRLLMTVAPGTINPTLGASCDAQMAHTLLQYMDKKHKIELREEYQRLLFGGNSTSELIELGAWTMDKTATTDLDNPIHDLLTRSRWEVTTHRGVPNADGSFPNYTKKVYNFPTQKGEYCAANDFVWMAIQPALRLATKILDSDHPATWIWADILKMRACTDSRMAPQAVQHVTRRHRNAGVDRQDYFSTYVDEDEDEFFPEQRTLKDLGFDSVYWVCQILMECLEWQFIAKFDGPLGGTTDVHQMAQTLLVRDNSSQDRPFRISIGISADYLWPLLVDEYSLAEKAVCSFTLASTIVHELCHALAYARDQLMHEQGIWLRFNPSGDWARAIGPDCLRALRTFGYRQVWDTTLQGQDRLVKFPRDSDHIFFADELEAEEGWATENQYWGGAPVHLNRASFLPETRFLDEVLTMCSFDSWPQDTSLRVFKVIPFSMISEKFTQKFWDHDMDKWGHEAMKIWPLASPRAFSNWSAFTWRQVQFRFGWAVRAWLSAVEHRIRYDYDHAVLWTWLRQLTRLAVEPRLCMIRWHEQQHSWKMTDKSLWALRNTCSAKADIVMNYLNQLYNETYSGQPMPPVEIGHFRNAFAALSSMQRFLSHEASLYQLITIDYHKQLDPVTKRDIQDYYAARLRDRLDAIHLKIITDCIAFLDMFTTVDPLILLRISQSDRAVELLDTARLELRQRFVAVQHAFRPVRQTFDEDRQAYVFNIEDFSNVSPISAVDTTKRIEKMAKKQVRTLSGPLLGIVQGWVHILERGERLKNAADGSPDAELNHRLAAVVKFVDDVKNLHNQQVDNQFPASQEVVRILSDPALTNLVQHNQNAPDPAMQGPRFNTVAPQQGQINSWQAVYAEASGFVPYQHPRTGFTRFHRANIPTEAGPSVNPTAAAQAQAQGQSLVGTFAPGGQSQDPADPDANFRGLMQGLDQRPPHPRGDALDAMAALIGERRHQLDDNPALAGQVVPSIYNRALQTVAGPNGAALVNNNLPGANNLFGTSSAQSSMAQQQLEDLIRQQTLGPNPSATLGNLPSQGPGVGVAPPSQAYEPVGSVDPQILPPLQPQNQQQGFQPQAPVRPQGGLAPPGPQNQPQGAPPQAQSQPQGGFAFPGLIPQYQPQRGFPQAPFQAQGGFPQPPPPAGFGGFYGGTGPQGSQYPDPPSPPPPT